MNFIEYLDALGRKSNASDHFGEWLGYEVETFDAAALEATTTLLIRNDHLSPSQAVHGGVVSAFLDFTCGAAAFLSLKPGKLCSTVELKVNYLRPLQLGDTVKGRAKIEFAGKTLIVVMASLHSAEKKVALATGTFNIY
jgi:acyl-coenzyme A thioesterase 13